MTSSQIPKGIVDVNAIFTIENFNLACQMLYTLEAVYQETKNQTILELLNSDHILKFKKQLKELQNKKHEGETFRTTNETLSQSVLYHATNDLVTDNNYSKRFDTVIRSKITSNIYPTIKRAASRATWDILMEALQIKTEIVDDTDQGSNLHDKSSDTENNTTNDLQNNSQNNDIKNNLNENLNKNFEDLNQIYPIFNDKSKTINDPVEAISVDYSRFPVVDSKETDIYDCIMSYKEEKDLIQIKKLVDQINEIKNKDSELKIEKKRKKRKKRNLTINSEAYLYMYYHKSLEFTKKLFANSLIDSRFNGYTHPSEDIKNRISQSVAERINYKEKVGETFISKIKAMLRKIIRIVNQPKIEPPITDKEIHNYNKNHQTEFPPDLDIEKDFILGYLFGPD